MADWIIWEGDASPTATASSAHHPVYGYEFFFAPLWTTENPAGASVALGSYDYSVIEAERLHPDDRQRTRDNTPASFANALSFEVWRARCQLFEAWLENTSDEAHDVALVLIADAGGEHGAYRLFGEIQRIAERLFPTEGPPPRSR